MAVILLIGKFMVKFSLNSESDIFLKNNNCQFILTINNKSIFPFPMAIVKIEYLNKFSSLPNNMFISVPIHPHTIQTITFNLSSDYCGIINVKIKSIKLFDYIKLFSCNIKSENNTEVFIIPEIFNDIPENDIKTISADDSEKFSKLKSGDDPSEIFELKNYVPGDKINRIHWNLSSKQNQLITKHYSQCISSPIIIIPDINFDQISLLEIDAVLELFYGISFYFTENEIIHKIYMPLFSENVNVVDYDTLNDCYINLLKGSHETDISLEEIMSMSEDNSAIYIVTNKEFKDYKISDISIAGEINYIFVSDSFGKPDFMQSDNIKISRLSSQTALDYLEQILL